MHVLWLEVKNADRYAIDDVEKVLRKKCSDFGMGGYGRYNAGWQFKTRHKCLQAKRAVRSFFELKKKQPVELCFWKVTNFREW